MLWHFASSFRTVTHKLQFNYASPRSSLIYKLKSLYWLRCVNRDNRIINSAVWRTKRLNWNSCACWRSRWKSDLHLNTTFGRRSEWHQLTSSRTCFYIKNSYTDDRLSSTLLTFIYGFPVHIPWVESLAHRLSKSHRISKLPWDFNWVYF
jgi:hypothetical protein